MLDTWQKAGIRCPLCDDTQRVGRTFMFWQHAMPEPTNLCVRQPCRCVGRETVHAELLDARLLRFPGWV